MRKNFLQCCVSDLQDERKVTVYNCMCLRYSVSEMLLSKLVCV